MTGCTWCHRPAPRNALQRVEVVGIRDPEDRLTLHLCRRCASVPGATWRRRWREER